MPIILLLFLFLSACSDDYYYKDDESKYQKDCIGEMDYETGEPEILCDYYKHKDWYQNESDECLITWFLIDDFDDEFKKEFNICQVEE